MFNYDASLQSSTTVSVSVLVLTLFIVVPSAFTLSIVLHDMCDGGGVVVAVVVHDFHDKVRLFQQRVVPHARTTAKCPSCEVSKNDCTNTVADDRNLVVLSLIGLEKNHGAATSMMLRNADEHQR